MVGRIEAYGGQPLAFVPLDITNNTVASVDWWLLGAAGQGQSDSVRFQHWLLRFGAASADLQHIFWEFQGNWFWEASSDLTSDLVYEKLRWERPAGGCSRSVCWNWQGQRPRRPVVRRKYVGVWNPGSRWAFTRCGSCCSSMPKRRTGGSSSLTRAMSSIRRTTSPLCRRCTTSDPVVCGLHLTATATDSPCWSGQAMGQVTYFTERRGWPMGTPCTWSHMTWGSSPLSGPYRRTTLLLLSHGMMMTPGQTALSLASAVIWTTWWWDSSHGDIYQNQLRAYWLLLHIMSHGWKPSFRGTTCK